MGINKTLLVQKKIRNQQIKDSYHDGMSVAEIVMRHNLSRQRVHQIIRDYVQPLSAAAKRKKALSIKKAQKRLEKAKKILKIPKLKKFSIASLTHIKTCSRDRIRELIRIRDKHTCQVCKKKWKPGTRRFDVHHLDENSEKSLFCDKLEDAKNLITLCHKCHLRWHYRSEFINRNDVKNNSHLTNILKGVRLNRCH